MDGDSRNFSKKRSNSHLKRKGGNKKGKWKNSSREQFSENSHNDDTVYRVLCPSRKIGSVIGKGGDRIKSLREETLAKITVADSVPGSDERVITIYSSPTKISRIGGTDDNPASENEDNIMEPHCAAQNALLKIHDRIIEEDLFGGKTLEDENENFTITARLLVPNNMVGCILGRGGDVIQKLRSETGATIRVLPIDHLPTCAVDTDELVQISGKPDIAKKALYTVSTLLHQNPRKDKPPSSLHMPSGRQNLNPRRMENMVPPGNPMWPYRNSSPHPMRSVPWMGGYGDKPHGFGPGGFDGMPHLHGGEASGEFYMKILCSSGRIGGVIGKGGVTVKQLQQETGATIHVEEASTDSEERVIRVSSHEDSWNPRSQTIEAILLLQNKISELSEKGIITTRLLVPSSKVGCILGQGGQIISEMRRRSRADIRVFSKDDKPKCASEDEELVQVSGNPVVAKDALAEIASRLRARCLRDVNSGELPAPVKPMLGFGLPGSVPGVSANSGAVGPGSSGGFELLKERGGYDYDYGRQSYPVPSAATGYPNFNSSLIAKTPNNLSSSLPGAGGASFVAFGEVGATRVKLQDPQAGGSECIVDIRGPSNHLGHAALQSISSGGRLNGNPPPGPYSSTYPHYAQPYSQQGAAAFPSTGTAQGGGGVGYPGSYFSLS